MLTLFLFWTVYLPQLVPWWSWSWQRDKLLRPPEGLLAQSPWKWRWCPSNSQDASGQFVGRTSVDHARASGISWCLTLSGLSSQKSTPSACWCSNHRIECGWTSQLQGNILYILNCMMKNVSDIYSSPLTNMLPDSGWYP